jgi:3-isopropylmalate/(R)-2-methylmalate dehydratase small subunit
VPARFLKEVTFSRMGEYPFFDERFGSDGKPKPHPFNDSRYQGASVLLVNNNFGCGSSREHAPQALNRFGLQAIVGESFAAIFQGNCLAIGLPAVTIAPEEMARLQDMVEEDPSVPFTVDLDAMVVRLPDRTIPCQMPDATRKALLEGNWDTTTMLAKNLPQVRQVASRLPYVGNFRG